MRRCVALHGCTCMIAQILLLREISVALHGNELIYGAVLVAWLLLVAAGAWLTGKLASRFRLGVSSFVLTLAGGGILVPISILLVRCARWACTGEGGAGLSLGSMALAALVVMAPLCLTLGAFFAIACAISMRGVIHPTRAASRVYVFESVGAFVGGILFTAILIRSFAPLSIALGIAAANCIAAFVAWYHSDRRARPWGWALLPAAALFIVCLATPAGTILDFASQAFSLRGSALRVAIETPYGRVTVAETADETKFCESGAQVGATNTDREAEERAYLALLSHPHPRKVLLIGGSLTGVLRKALRSPQLTVDCTEIDPAIVKAGARYISSLDIEACVSPRARIFTQAEGRMFLRRTRERYDVIISALPHPGTGLINRFYTADFFAEARAALSEEGVLLVGLNGTHDSMNAAQRILASGIDATLRSVFETVVVLPAEDAVYYLATGRENPGFPHVEMWPDRVEALGLKPIWLTSVAVDEMTTGDRATALRSEISGRKQAPINTDLRPLTYVHALLRGAEKLQPGMRKALHAALSLDLASILLVVAILTGLLCLATTFAQRPLMIGVPATCAFAGGSGMVLAMALLFTFQGLYGSAYSAMGIVFAAFMVGTTLGAAITQRLEVAGSELKVLMLLQTAMAVLAAVTIPILSFLGAAGPRSIELGSMVLIPLINMCAGALVGAQFPIAITACTPGVRTTRETGLAARLYAADLAGACAGALIASVVLIPLLGLHRTCWTVSVLSLATLPLLLLSERRRP